MNLEKAKEFFSAYYEGSLEAGLRESFERRLKTDAVLRGEYEAFERTMLELEGLKFLTVPVPEDLNERIAQRLDKHIHDQKRVSSAGWTGWIRNLAFAGLAAAAVFGAILTISRGGGDASQASVVTASGSPQLQAKASDRDVLLTYNVKGSETVTVRNSDGIELTKVSLKDQTWENTLTNPLASSALFHVEIAGTGEHVQLVLPGTARETAKTGDGTLIDFAKALSGFYRLPVMVRAKDTARSVRWDFREADVTKAASTALAPESNAQLTVAGVLVIQ